MLISTGLRQLWVTTPGNSAITLYLAIATMLMWILGLKVNGAWETSILGQGSQEYNRVFRGLDFSTVILALIGLGLQLAAMRPWVFAVLPFACFFSTVGRYSLRQRLYRRRAQGECMHQILAVGTEE